eukprot:scaffold32333_cov63-Attheya_sp.AAC.1
MACNAKSNSKSMNDDLDKDIASDPMIVDPPSTSSKPPSKTTMPKPKSVSAPQNDNDTTGKETSPPSTDTYCIPAVHTQWLFFRFKNVPPLSKNTKASKHKLLADPPTTTKVKSKDKKNLNNMAKLIQCMRKKLAKKNGNCS